MSELSSPPTTIDINTFNTADDTLLKVLQDLGLRELLEELKKCTASIEDVENTTKCLDKLTDFDTGIIKSRHKFQLQCDELRRRIRGVHQVTEEILKNETAKVSIPDLIELRDQISNLIKDGDKLLDINCELRGCVTKIVDNIELELGEYKSDGRTNKVGAGVSGGATVGGALVAAAGVATGGAVIAVGGIISLGVFGIRSLMRDTNPEERLDKKMESLKEHRQFLTEKYKEMRGILENGLQTLPIVQLNVKILKSKFHYI